MPRHLTEDNLNLQWDGEAVSQDELVNFLGGGVEVTDDPGGNQTVVSISGSSSSTAVNYRTVNYLNESASVPTSGVIDFGTLFDVDAEYGDPFLDFGVGQTDVSEGRFVFAETGIYEIMAQIARGDPPATYTAPKRLALMASTDDARHSVRYGAPLPTYGQAGGSVSFWAQLHFTDYYEEGTVLTVAGLPGYSFENPTGFQANIVLTQIVSGG